MAKEPYGKLIEKATWLFDSCICAAEKKKTMTIDFLEINYIWISSAFSKTRLPPELWRVLSFESPAVFLHFPLEEKGP